MCRAGYCPGHNNAPSKEECMACFGHNYGEEEDEEDTGE